VALFNARYIQPGSVNTTGQYNHFSALRSYEDLLGLDKGGDDGHGHLGFAAQRGLAGATFGRDVFNRDAREAESR
jgi:phosphatidylinositol-3-phosphatase